MRLRMGLPWVEVAQKGDGAQKSGLGVGDKGCGDRREKAAVSTLRFKAFPKGPRG